MFIKTIFKISFLRNLSVQAIFLLLFSGLTTSILTPVFFIEYMQYSTELDKKFNWINHQTEINVLNSVASISKGRNVLRIAIQDELNKKLTLFLNEYKKNVSDVLAWDLESLKKDMGEGYELHVIEANSLKIVNTTRIADRNLDFNLWPLLAKNLKILLEKKERRISKLSRSKDSNTSQVNAYIPTNDGNYILEISARPPLFIELKRTLKLRDYVRQIVKFTPYLIRLNFYDINNQSFQNKSYKATEDEINIFKSIWQTSKKLEIIDKEEKYYKNYFFINLYEQDDFDDTSLIAELVFDLKKLNQEKARKKIILITIYFLTLLLTYIFSRLASGFITSHIRNIISDVKKVAEGNLDFQIRPTGQREVDTLTASINSMSGNLKNKIAEKRRLSQDLIKAQEQERRRIASDLHDSVGQNLMAAKLHIELGMKELDTAKLNHVSFEHLQKSVNIIEFTSQELRDIYNGIYPSILSDLGLKSAILWYTDHFFPFRIERDVRIDIKNSLSYEIEVNIFRIVQEIFSNIKKHSYATFFQLILMADSDSIRLFVSDNGCGMDTNSRKTALEGFGMRSIGLRVEELQGSWTLTSQPNGGVAIEIIIKGT